jgi:sulfur relay (sulfurtransferase) DsrF/TusC family protein
MVKSIVIVCEQSPIGKNSAIEAIRMAAGIMAVGDLENCKVVFMGDAVLFLNKSFNPKAVNMDDFSNVFRLMELSDIEVYALDKDLEVAGLTPSDLIDYDNVNVASIKDISKFLLEADASYRY